MSVTRFPMEGGFCMSQRWQSHTLVELQEAMDSYKLQYPRQGYDTRFTEPYYDEEEMRWNTIMKRDRSCD